MSAGVFESVDRAGTSSGVVRRAIVVLILVAGCGETTSTPDAALGTMDAPSLDARAEVGSDAPRGDDAPVTMLDAPLADDAPLGSDGGSCTPAGMSCTTGSCCAGLDCRALGGLSVCVPGTSTDASFSFDGSFAFDVDFPFDGSFALDGDFPFDGSFAFDGGFPSDGSTGVDGGRDASFVRDAGRDASTSFGGDAGRDASILAGGDAGTPRDAPMCRAVGDSCGPTASCCSGVCSGSPMGTCAVCGVLRDRCSPTEPCCGGFTCSPGPTGFCL